MKPFFTYYGGKWRSALKNYPPPDFKTIVEPFAGSAGYSLRYYDRKVILCDIDPVIYGVWKYLTSVSKNEILQIPNLRSDETVDDLHVCQEAKWLVGFWLNKGSRSPCRSPSKWMRDGTHSKSFWGDEIKKRIASQVDHIRHWDVRNTSYDKMHHDGPATWFIDPPYIGAGKFYRFSSKNIDYESLSMWCLGRLGQVIVCENHGASWLPFERVSDERSTVPGRISQESVWINDLGDLGDDLGDLGDDLDDLDDLGDDDLDDLE